MKSLITALSLLLASSLSAESITVKNVSINFDRDTYQISFPDARVKTGIVKPNLHLKYDDFVMSEKFALGIDRFNRDDSYLYIVKYKTEIIDQYQEVMQSLGVELFNYVPDHAQLVMMSPEKIEVVESQSFVDSVQKFLPVYKLDSLIFSDISKNGDLFFKSIRRYNLVATQPKFKNHLYNVLKKSGVLISSFEGKGLVVVARMSGEQLAEVIGSRYIKWAEYYTEPEMDMDNVYIQAGVNDLLLHRSASHLGGEGIRGHIMEGVYREHPDLAASEYRDAPVGVWDDSPASHGHSTFGIVFADGKGNPMTKGLLPKGQGYYTHYNAVYGNSSRYDLVNELQLAHKVMFQTASWGYARTTEYGARSAEMDHLIFHLDMPITQSQSNAGARPSRPQAWAKNIISVGGIRHADTPNPMDDRWGRSGSIGPASDGRIKPDLSAYYDAIDTLEPTGYGTFGGTSGATPIVAGLLGLTIEMYVKGMLDSEVNGEDLYKNRPHAMTAKALLISSARQYDFRGRSHDLTRAHQGWGLPNVEDIYKDAQMGKLHIVDESETLLTGESYTLRLSIGEETPELKATMIFREPEALVSASKQVINNLDLKLTSPSGKTYYGNIGLEEGTESLESEEGDSINTVENIILKNPEVGEWELEVKAQEINVDANRHTPGLLDSRFSLVVRGVEVVP